MLIQLLIQHKNRKICTKILVLRKDKFIWITLQGKWNRIPKRINYIDKNLMKSNKHIPFMKLNPPNKRLLNKLLRQKAKRFSKRRLIKLDSPLSKAQLSVLRSKSKRKSLQETCIHRGLIIPGKKNYQERFICQRWCSKFPSDGNMEKVGIKVAKLTHTWRLSKKRIGFWEKKRKDHADSSRKK